MKPAILFTEQRRIVAKVEELMRWCDQLETQLTAAQSAATHLLAATVAKLHSAQSLVSAHLRPSGLRT